MNRTPRALPAAVVALLLAVSGCQFVAPKNKLASLQSQNRVLNEQSKSQLVEIENLKVHARQVEDQLIQAEEELARTDQRSGKKLAKRSAGTRGPGIPAGISDRLSALSQRYPSLQYDAETGISKFDTDVLFDSGAAELRPSAAKMLDEFAAIMRSPDAAEMKVMVVGHTDARSIRGREVRERYPDNWRLSAGRALSVADRLRKAGLPEERMGVAGFGPAQPISPNDTASARSKNRRVEIFVVGPETPVVGWTETLGSVYR